MLGSCEKPSYELKTSRSRALSAIAIAGRCLLDFGSEIMPKAIFAREKWESGGIGSHERNGIVIALLRVPTVACYPRQSGSFETT